MFKFKVDSMQRLCRDPSHNSSFEGQSLYWLPAVEFLPESCQRTTLQPSLGWHSKWSRSDAAEFCRGVAPCSVRAFLAVMFSRNPCISDLPPFHCFMVLYLALLATHWWCRMNSNFSNCSGFCSTPIFYVSLSLGNEVFSFYVVNHKFCAPSSHLL